MTQPTFEILPNEAVPPSMQTPLDQYDAEAFAGHPIVDDYQWSTPAWRLIVRVGDDIAGHVGLFERDCRVGGQAMRLGGVGSVMTRAQYRGRGLASIGMTAAAEFFRDHRPFEFALLVCVPSLVAFYQGLGWQTVQGSVVAEHPQRGLVTMHEVKPLVLALHDGVWPRGDIELLGLPW